MRLSIVVIILCFTLNYLSPGNHLFNRPVHIRIYQCQPRVHVHHHRGKYPGSYLHHNAKTWRLLCLVPSLSKMNAQRNRAGQENKLEQPRYKIKVKASHAPCRDHITNYLRKHPICPRQLVLLFWCWYQYADRPPSPTNQYVVRYHTTPLIRFRQWLEVQAPKIYC